MSEANVVDLAILIIAHDEASAVLRGVDAQMGSLNRALYQLTSPVPDKGSPFDFATSP